MAVTQRWTFWALLSAVFEALTALFAMLRVSELKAWLGVTPIAHA